MMGLQREQVQLPGKRSVFGTPKPSILAQLLQWRKLPQWINKARYQFAASPQVDTLMGYEPLHLQVLCNTPYQPQVSQSARMSPLSTVSRKEMNLESFRFVLDQVPAAQSIEFSGWGEPLLNPDLFKMVTMAYEVNRVDSVVYTNGFLLAERAQEMLASALDTLVVRLHGHRPSAYAAVTGKPPRDFVVVSEQVRHLVAARRAAGNTRLTIVVSFTVDIHNFREIPQMVQWAETLGVDGVVLENYQSADPAMLSDRSLFDDMEPVTQYLRELRAEWADHPTMQVTWPELLLRDHAGVRRCQDSHRLVAVDGECNVSGCSRQLVMPGALGKIWDPDFWNGPAYQKLRALCDGSQGGELPEPCRVCPRNIGTPLA